MINSEQGKTLPHERRRRLPPELIGSNCPTGSYQLRADSTEARENSCEPESHVSVSNSFREELGRPLWNVLHENTPRVDAHPSTISETMLKRDDFARSVREGAGTFTVDKVAIRDAQKALRFRGSGLLRVTTDHLEIDLALRGTAPPILKRVLTEKDYWTLNGVINGELPFSSGFITPIGRLGETHVVFKITRTLHDVDFITKPVNPVRIRAKQRALARRFHFTPQARSKRGSDRSFLFLATFVDHPLPGANAGTETITKNDFLGEGKSSHADTFIGDTGAGEYALIKSNDDEDLELRFRSKPDWKSPGEDDDRRKFEALLHALAFSTGIQPWPFRTTYSRGRGFVISDVIRAALPPPRTEFAPLSQTFGKDAGVPLAAAIRAAAEFLEPNTPFNQKLIELLFLFRQAGAVQSEIATLTVCTLLESLIRTLFANLCAHKSTAPDALNQLKFEQLKKSFLRRVGARAASSKGPEYLRLTRCISGAPLFEIRDMFQAVADRLNIGWKSEMEPIFREWKNARNPAAHGAFRRSETEGEEQQEAEEMFFGQSRIAGAFNMVLLKLFGYSGPYVASVIEGTRQTIAQRPAA
jgi:hypothetical protein